MNRQPAQPHEPVDLISVIIPAYNHENYVQDTIQSIIDQSYSNVELIIVNDGSTDKTHHKIEELLPRCEEHFHHVDYINKSNEGLIKSANLRPFETQAFITSEIGKEKISAPRNLEERAISLIGRPLYEAFIKGYIIKEWEKDPGELPSDIITRLPVRHNYNNRYFNDKHDGIPLDGYARLFERMLDHPNIEVRLNADYFYMTEELGDIPTVYTGPIDRFFAYKEGVLDWRTIDFEHTANETPDYQGCTVMNFADESVPYTRVHEFKHYHPERPQTDSTVIFHEYSRIAERSDEPCYPLNTPRNTKLLKKYSSEAAQHENVIFSGSLGEYRYLDMDSTIARALDAA